MYIDTSAILDIAAIVAAISTIISIIIGVHKFVERDKRQTTVIEGIAEILKRLQTVNRSEKDGKMPSFSFLNDENGMFVSANARPETASNMSEI